MPKYVEKRRSRCGEEEIEDAGERIIDRWGQALMSGVRRQVQEPMWKSGKNKRNIAWFKVGSKGVEMETVKTVTRNSQREGNTERFIPNILSKI